MRNKPECYVPIVSAYVQYLETSLRNLIEDKMEDTYDVWLKSKSKVYSWESLRIKIVTVIICVNQTVPSEYKWQHKVCMDYVHDFVQRLGIDFLLGEFFETLIISL